MGDEKKSEKVRDWLVKFHLEAQSCHGSFSPCPSNDILHGSEADNYVQLPAGDENTTESDASDYEIFLPPDRPEDSDQAFFETDYLTGYESKLQLHEDEHDHFDFAREGDGGINHDYIQPPLSGDHYSGCEPEWHNYFNSEEIVNMNFKP